MSDERSGGDAPDSTRRTAISRSAAPRTDYATTVRRADFDAFYRSEVGLVVGFIMKIGATEHEAADAAQSAFTHAWVAWEFIHSNRRAWVRTVATREFYRQIPRYGLPGAGVPDFPILLLPDIVVEISERTKIAHELLAGLPTTQRHIMAWTADGFSIAEIARATGKSEAAVRKNLQRARDTLKTRLAAIEGGAK